MKRTRREKKTKLREGIMTQYTRIFIIGHSGAGKGVLAQAVAQKLGWKFIDADFSLVPSIGRSLPEILSDAGKQSFCHCLSNILLHQLTQQNIVVTTDDGIVDDEKNCALLAPEFTVYLQVSLDVQLERIAHNRPLLPVADYRAFLNKLRQERDHLYEQTARFTLSSDDGAIESHAMSIIKAMQET